MLLPLISIIIGFILVVWSADRFIDGAAATAHYLGISPLAVGVLIVGFGTSAPEILVSISAALDGETALALGNALGSNIVNSTLVMGVTALITPVLVSSNIVRRELPLLLLIILLVGIFIYDGNLTRIESAVLVAGLILMIAWSYFNVATNKNSAHNEQLEQHSATNTMPLRKALFLLIAGLFILFASSQILVWGAVQFAIILKVDNLVIGLTIVAIGTSLPELAASIAAIRKQEHDIAIGNVVGANLFNLFAVIGIAGVIKPITELPNEVFYRDWLAMLLITIAFYVMTISMSKSKLGKITRIKATLLILGYFIHLNALKLPLFN